MKWNPALAIAGIVLAAGLSTLAANPFHNPKVAKELNLTPEQQQKLDDLRYQHRKDAVTLKRDMELKRLDLEREMEKDNPDPQVIDRLMDEQGALRTRMGKAKFHNLMDMKKILTPEQWSKVREQMQSHRAQRGRFAGENRRGGRGERPDGPPHTGGAPGMSAPGAGSGPERGPGGPMMDDEDEEDFAPPSPDGTPGA
jgi:Spy/CpxP family protein refolding chaperone